MTPEQTKLIKQSWKQANQSDLVSRFYNILFQLDPALEDMFLSSLSLQEEKFRVTLGLIVEQLDDPAGLSAKVQKLGLQHAGFGVRSEHYDLVHTALISALSDALGEDFNSATQQSWTDAYWAVANDMQMADIDSIGQPL